MTRIEVPGHPVFVTRSWTPAETHQAIAWGMKQLEQHLPETSRLIVIKANVSIDRPGVISGTTDLRVLVALVEWLQAKGYRDIALAETPLAPWHRAGIAPWRRLRIDRLVQRYGLSFLDLNLYTAQQVSLPIGAVRVPRILAEAGLLINLAGVRTHPEVGLAMGAWNLKGLVLSADRALLMREPAESLIQLARFFGTRRNEHPWALGLDTDKLPPSLAPLATGLPADAAFYQVPSIHILDALIAMEGEGPLEGTPRRLERLLFSDNVLSLDLVAARLFGYTPEEVPHVWQALYDHDLPPEAQILVEDHVSVLWDLRRPRVRGAAYETGQMVKGWFQGVVRRRQNLPGWAKLADRLKLRFQVSTHEDRLEPVVRRPERCGECRRCEAFCPTGMTREEIGLTPAADACLQCLSCYAVCDKQALSVNGEPGAVMHWLAQYKSYAEQL